MKVRAYWMKNDYTWKKSIRIVETREQAKSLSEETSKRLNRLLNSGMIRDYRVEY